MLATTKMSKAKKGQPFLSFEIIIMICNQASKKKKEGKWYKTFYCYLLPPPCYLHKWSCHYLEEKWQKILCENCQIMKRHFIVLRSCFATVGYLIARVKITSWQKLLPQQACLVNHDVLHVSFLDGCHSCLQFSLF